ncbi:MAG TPA: hypothetical protein VIY99_17610 [Terracidiphilus sp.]
MISRDQSVQLTGMLVSAERKAECILIAEQHLITFTPARYEYVAIQITNAPDDLPDGKYELIFDQRICRVQKLHGKWINHFWTV